LVRGGRRLRATVADLFVGVGSLYLAPPRILRDHLHANGASAATHAVHRQSSSVLTWPASVKIAA
jgi:hypothetical protein